MFKPLTWMACGLVLSGCGLVSKKIHIGGGQSSTVDAAFREISEELRFADESAELASRPTPRSPFEALRSFGDRAWRASCSEAWAAPTECEGVEQASCDAEGVKSVKFENCQWAYWVGGVKKFSPTIHNGGKSIRFLTGSCNKAYPPAVPVGSSISVLRKRDDGSTSLHKSGVKFTYLSDSATGWDGTVELGAGGGKRLTWSHEEAGKRSLSLEILGVQKIATKGMIKRLDQTFSTSPDAPILVSYTAPTPPQKRGISLVNGKLIVQKNLARRVATITYTDVLHDPNRCRCPLGGTAESRVTDGTKTITRVVAYSDSCGKMKLTLASGRETEVERKWCQLASDDDDADAAAEELSIEDEGADELGDLDDEVTSS